MLVRLPSEFIQVNFLDFDQIALSGKRIVFVIHYILHTSHFIQVHVQLPTSYLTVALSESSIVKERPAYSKRLCVITLYRCFVLVLDGLF